ncbi:UMP-CMP kinase 3 [Spatholobus suberectus]|nr:UMP-CMP kinase 3 [Spatholobus suberectus]
MGTDVEASNQPNSFEGANVSIVQNKPAVVFVLGGPGSGKGTQCANIVQQFGYTHLSAGDLLRAEIESGSENGTMIDNMIKEGQIVPSEVTTKLLQRAMQESGNDKFLIDGFPRNEENRAAFENVTGIEPVFILFFDCPEEEMERRLLSRNQGRKDDNIETIRKRFKVFMESSLPVIAYYDAKGKVYKIDAARPVEEIFESVKTIFELYYKVKFEKIREILQYMLDRKMVTEGTEIWEIIQEALNISRDGIKECKCSTLEEKEDLTH